MFFIRVVKQKNGRPKTKTSSVTPGCSYTFRTTVDGRNPANQLRLVVEIPLLSGFQTCQVVVWDFFHQRYFIPWGLGKDFPPKYIKILYIYMHIVDIYKSYRLYLQYIYHMYLVIHIFLSCIISRLRIQFALWGGHETKSGRRNGSSTQALSPTRATLGKVCNLLRFKFARLSISLLPGLFFRVLWGTCLNAVRWFVV